MKKYLLIFLILLLVFCGCKQPIEQHDTDYSKALQYISLGEYTLAYEYLCKSAEGGNPEAQYNLAFLYYNGVGVQQNVKAAFSWYLAAANLGHDPSMAILGEMYLSAINGIRECDKAIKWIEKAADEGNVGAMRQLANMSNKGICVSQDLNKAASIYKTIFKNENTRNITKGAMYFSGSGVEKNYSKAIELIKSDYDNYQAKAGYLLGMAYANGYGVRKDYKKAYSYYLDSAVYGNSSSQYNAGVYLYNGTGVEESKSAALKWIKKSAQKNHKKALAFMGFLYETGEMVEQSKDVAVEYYRKASILGDEYAKERMNVLNSQK